MKHIFFLAAFLTYKVADGQLKIILGKPRQLTKREMKEDERNHNCFYKKNYSSQQRLQFFPFSQTHEIILASFTQPDSLVLGGELPLKNGKVDLVRLRETKALSTKQIDTLTDLLYNQSYAGHFYTLHESGCYNPRNAILFLDASHETFAFIELCFQCYGHRLSSTKVKVGDFCSQKYELLREFFVKNGISYGVKRQGNDDD